MIKINVKKMVAAADGVGTFFGLAVFLSKKGIDVQERTLYRWQNGTGFNKDTVEKVAKALGLEMRDVVIW